MSRPKRRGVSPVDPASFPVATRTDLRVAIYEDGLGNPLYCPIVVLRGAHPGPTLGLSAAVHGDELNGIRIIHSLLGAIDPATLHGTLLCAPIVNVPAFQAEQRRFPEDHRDLNTVFPGKTGGLPSEQYARAFQTVFVEHLDYLVDIHTASRGRINTFYVRADLTSPEARELALLMHPTIVLHGKSGDGTLRSAARGRGVHAITVEAGNPEEFQGRMVDRGEQGVRRVLAALEMWRGPSEKLPDAPPILCRKSTWLRTRGGGLLVNEFRLGESVEKKQRLAHLVDPYGHELESYTAPTDGVVIGMSRHPVAVPGTRFCHLGTPGDPLDGEGDA
ncbi:MAG: succinylglutamate desuccinylase/aspartoacylase family protein [Planctomycetes bacterium]|nr:succinylglutamate desuccinylase/aspartoacylase family protein [Planctomycetota bacterium]